MKTAHLSTLIAGFLLIGPAVVRVASYECNTTVVFNRPAGEQSLQACARIGGCLAGKAISHPRNSW
jgi:hypothetical protein